MKPWCLNPCPSTAHFTTPASALVSLHSNRSFLSFSSLWKSAIETVLEAGFERSYCFWLLCPPAYAFFPLVYLSFYYRWKPLLFDIDWVKSAINPMKKEKIYDCVSMKQGSNKLRMLPKITLINLFIVCLNFYWSIVSLHCCVTVSFCRTATWISCTDSYIFMYTYIPSELNFLPI